MAKIPTFMASALWFLVKFDAIPFVHPFSQIFFPVFSRFVSQIFSQFSPFSAATGNQLLGLAEFLGIPFAQAPVEQRRWAPSEKMESWNQVFQVGPRGPLKMP